MSEQTKIAWCDSTLNFWSGCTKVSPGCAHCYAETLSNRFPAQVNDPDAGTFTEPAFGGWGKGAPRKRHESAFKLAHRLNRKPWICDECGTASPIQFENTDNPKHHCGTCKKSVTMHRRRIFSLSLGDWLDAEVPIAWLAEMLDTIRQCDQVTWMLCTKRPENFFDRLGAVQELVLQGQSNPEFFSWLCLWGNGQPPANIILLTSVENQEQVWERIPHLVKIPAACRGLSLEPLLGAQGKGNGLNDEVDVELRHGCRGCNHPGNIVMHYNEHGRCSLCDGTRHEPSGIDWLIIGGESGANARPCNVEWIRSLVAQGKAAGAAVFVKQLGACPVNESGNHYDIDLRHKKGGDPSEWPADLRVQEWPKGF